MTTRRNSVPFPYEHIQHLENMGYATHSITRAAKLGTPTIQRGRQAGRCTPHTRERLLAVTPDTIGTQPAWRATRRIRALAAAGVNYDTIATESGVNTSRIAGLATGRYVRIYSDTFKGINRVWEARKDNPVTRPDARIAAKKWAVPWAWDDIDGDIDLHGDAIVSADGLRTALRRGITQFGQDTIRRELGLTPDTLKHYLNTPRAHESRVSDMLAALYRLSERHRWETGR